jgi:hypothetical protein
MKTNYILLSLLIFSLCSCDKPRPSVSTAPPATEESSDEPDYRPPPMHLDHTVRISDYPFEIRAPERWDWRSNAVNILEGPTPHGPKPAGTIHLTATRRGPLPKTITEAFKSSSTKPAATNDSFFRHTTRTIGKLEIQEQRALEPAAAPDPQRIKWTISIFQPVDKDNVLLFQLTFLDLTREHFEKDRELLESMIASIAPAQEEPSLK